MKNLPPISERNGGSTEGSAQQTCSPGCPQHLVSLSALSARGQAKNGLPSLMAEMELLLHTESAIKKKVINMISNPFTKTLQA